MIANGWLSARDYYQALAQACGVPFRHELRPGDVASPTSLAGPRQCLTRGLLKERTQHSAYVLAPETLRPTAVAEMLHRLMAASPFACRAA